MKRNAKSSVTLPAEELALIEELRKRLGAKSKVEVIRRSLWELKQRFDRRALSDAYRSASEAVREDSREMSRALDALEDTETDE